MKASDTGSSGGTGGHITGYSIDWGDGTPDTTSSTAPSNVTHTYSGNGPFVVNETITGTPAANFGGDGHETDECAGSPVSFSGNNNGNNGNDNNGNDNNGNTKCKDDKGNGDDSHAGDPNDKNCPPECSGSTSEPGGDAANPDADDKCPQPCPDNAKRGDDGSCPQPCPDNAKRGDDGNCKPEPCPDNAKRGDDGKCPPPCEVEGHENDEGCPPPPCKLDDPHNVNEHDADDKTIEEGGTCPNSHEFDRATFYAAEDNPMHVVVDASAVNAPSNSNSNGDPIPGDKVTTCNAATVNACHAVANLDKDADISDYTWTFTAWRFNKTHPATPDWIEQFTVDSHTSPSAAAQFTKTQGDDVVQITLTITEDKEGPTTIQTPMPKFDAATGSPAQNKPPEYDKPAKEQGDVILEPCDHGGLITAPSTLGDTLGDAIGGVGPLLGDPNVNGPLTSAVEDATVTTPLASVGNEVACLVSFLVPGQI